MKTKLFAFTLVVCLVLLAGCQNTNQAASLTKSELPSDQVEATFQQLTSLELKDFDQLYEQYLRTPFGATIIATTWTNANDIDPDCFVDFFSYDQFYQNISWEGGPGYPAEVLEPMVQKYFDVSTNHMRTSKRYNATENIYLSEGIGGAASAKVVAAKQEKDILVLGFEVYGAADDVTIIWGGNLSIQMQKDGYRYIACEQYDR